RKACGANLRKKSISRETHPRFRDLLEPPRRVHLATDSSRWYLGARYDGPVYRAIKKGGTSRRCRSQRGLVYSSCREPSRTRRNCTIVRTGPGKLFALGKICRTKQIP